jgi:hexosaminidase
LGESQILGIEAALWTETLRTRAQLEQMMFPRLACIAEKAWSPRGMASAQGFWARIDAQRKVWDNEAIRHYVES